MTPRELLAELERVAAAGLPCCWCTLVATRGSTPQKAGAAMLVFPDGSQAGTLGGGCVEAEVKRRALVALSDATGPQVHTFTLDDDHGWDDGLICGGRMTVLAAPVGPDDLAYIRALKAATDAGPGLTEAVALPGNARGLPVGTRVLVGNGDTKPTSREGFAVLTTRPRIRLLVVGGGHVGQAVARLAAECDFDVWVLDDRDSLVSAARFPTAARRLVGDIGRTLQSLAADISATTYGLIVTRGHNHDEEALYHLARTAAGYVGMIGSRRKVRLIFDDLRAKGVPDAALARVRAPVGLAIGSQSVPEIAVSIVAELISWRNVGAGNHGDAGGDSTGTETAPDGSCVAESMVRSEYPGYLES